jgi:hypothetical protein
VTEPGPQATPTEDGVSAQVQVARSTVMRMRCWINTVDGSRGAVSAAGGASPA